MTVDAYLDDLAFIHDVGYGDYARRCAPGLLKIIQRNGSSSKHVVDLGCGSGIWARILLDAGHQVTGYDLSAAMIKLARQKAPEADFHCGSFLDADLPPCDVVTSMGEPFNYLFDKRNKPGQLTRLLRRIFRALRPGGLLLFEVAEPGRSRGVTQTHREGEGWACLVDYEFPQGDQLVRHITTFRRRGQHFRRSTETHRLQLYRGADLARLLRELGFRARSVRRYGDFVFPKKLVGLVARKPQ